MPCHWTGPSPPLPTRAMSLAFKAGIAYIRPPRVQPAAGHNSSTSHSATYISLPLSYSLHLCLLSLFVVCVQRDSCFAVLRGRCPVCGILEAARGFISTKLFGSLPSLRKRISPAETTTPRPAVYTNIAHNFAYCQEGSSHLPTHLLVSQHDVSCRRRRRGCSINSACTCAHYTQLYTSLFLPCKQARLPTLIHCAHMHESASALFEVACCAHTIPFIRATSLLMNERYCSFSDRLLFSFFFCIPILALVH